MFLRATFPNFTFHFVFWLVFLVTDFAIKIQQCLLFHCGIQNTGPKTNQKVGFGGAVLVHGKTAKPWTRADNGGKVMAVIVVWERVLLRISGPGKHPGMCIATSRSPKQLVMVSTIMASAD